jgi:uncharacterized protein
MIMSNSNSSTDIESETLTLQDRRLKRSRFLHRLNKGDGICLFHSLTQHKVFGGLILGELFDFLGFPHTLTEIQSAFLGRFPQAALNAAYSDLAAKGMLIADNDEDLVVFKRFLYHGLIERPIQHMYFLPTNVCNLRCRYCFVEDINKPLLAVNMTQEIARKTIEIFAKLTREAEKISLAIYGGEPLCNRDVVYTTLRYVRELERSGHFAKSVELTMLTNGLLVDETTVDIARETQTFVAISWDGPDEFHDSVRLDVGGGPTSAKALRAFHLLQDAGLTPGISCTIHRYNVDHIVEIAQYIAEKLKPSGMGFNLLLPLIGSGNPLDVPHDYAVQQLIKAFKILREHGIYEDRIMRRLKPFVERGFYYKDCMGVGGQIVVTPEGQIGPCQGFIGVDGFFPLGVDELHACLEELDSSRIYAHPLFNEWNLRLPLNMSNCVDCFAISVCGGGCPYASYANHNSIWKVDERICFQAKAVYEWLIWETYDRMLCEIESSSGSLPS